MGYINLGTCITVLIILLCCVPPVIFFKCTYLPNVNKLKMYFACIFYGIAVNIIINILLFEILGIIDGSITCGLFWAHIGYFICLKMNKKENLSSISTIRSNLRENLKPDTPPKEPEQITLDSIVDMTPAEIKKPKKSKKVLVLSIFLVLSLVTNAAFAVSSVYENKKVSSLQDKLNDYKSKYSKLYAQVATIKNAGKFESDYLSKLHLENENNKRQEEANAAQDKARQAEIKKERAKSKEELLQNVEQDRENALNILTAPLKGEKTSENTNSSNEDLIVYISGKGIKYHLEDCRIIAKLNPTPISLKTAVNEGYEPCSVCNPPKPD